MSCQPWLQQGRVYANGLSSAPSEVTGGCCDGVALRDNCLEVFCLEAPWGQPAGLPLGRHALQDQPPGAERVHACRKLGCLQMSCRCCTADIGAPMWSPSQLYQAQVLKSRLPNPHLCTHQSISRLFCHFKHQPFLFKLNCSNSYLYLSLCLALGLLLPAAQTSGCSWAAVLCLAVALTMHSSPCQAAGKQRWKGLQRQRGCGRNFRDSCKGSSGWDGGEHSNAEGVGWAAPLVAQRVAARNSSHHR